MALTHLLNGQSKSRLFLHVTYQVPAHLPAPGVPLLPWEHTSEGVLISKSQTVGGLGRTGLAYRFVEELNLEVTTTVLHTGNGHDHGNNNGLSLRDHYEQPLC